VHITSHTDAVIVGSINDEVIIHDRAGVCLSFLLQLSHRIDRADIMCLAAVIRLLDSFGRFSEVIGASSRVA
jgi:hypothetical protein